MRERTVVEVPAESESLFVREFVLLLLAQTCFGMSFSSMFLLPKYLKVALAASDAQVGAVQASAALAGVLTFPIVGALNDRIGRKPFMVLGAVCVTYCAYATLSLAEVNFAFYALRVLQGVSFALFFNSASTLAADRVAAQHLGRALAVLGASMLVTNALSPALAELLAHRHGWPWMFYMAIAWGIVSIGATLALDEHKAQKLTSGERRGGLYELLQSPTARQIALLMATTGAGFGTVFTFYQPYALSLGITHVSSFFVSYAVFALTTRLGLMARIERYGRREASAFSMLVYAVGVAGTAFLRPGVLEVVGAVLGLAQGVFYPVFNALALEAVPRHQRGSMMALYHGSFNAGTALLMFTGGSLAGAFGYRALFFGTGALTAFGAVTLMYSRRFAGSPA